MSAEIPENNVVPNRTEPKIVQRIANSYCYTRIILCNNENSEFRSLEYAIITTRCPQCNLSVNSFMQAFLQETNRV